MIAWQKRKEIEKQRILDEHAFSWDQNPGEPNNAFALFKLYLSIGKTRSYIKTQNLSGEFSYTTIQKFANEYQWKIRADAADRAHDEEIRVKLDEEILENKLRSLNVGVQLQDLAAKGAEMLMAEIEELSPSDIVRLADIGTKITNLALGSATEIKDVKSESKVEIKVEEIPKEISERIGKELAIAASRKMEE